MMKSIQREIAVVIVIIVILVPFIMSQTAHAEGQGEYGFITEWKDWKDGFSYPAGTAVNSHGDVYVADTGNHRVQGFTRGDIVK